MLLGHQITKQLLHALFHIFFLFFYLTKKAEHVWEVAKQFLTVVRYACSCCRSVIYENSRQQRYSAGIRRLRGSADYRLGLVAQMYGRSFSHKGVNTWAFHICSCFSSTQLRLHSSYVSVSDTPHDAPLNMCINHISFLIWLWMFKIGK